MRILTQLALLGAVVVLAGCVSTTAPVSVGPDTYMIGAGAHGGFQSDAELLSETIQRAGAFCAQQGRQILVRHTTTSGVQGWTPQQNQVVFSCVQARPVSNG